MLMRGSRQCNLNSVDIYCQGALIQRPPLLHRLTQHQRAAGSEERHPPFTVLLADLPPDCFCDCKHTHTHPNPQPIGHRPKKCLVECHLYRLCPLGTETPPDCIAEDAPLSSFSVTTGMIPYLRSSPFTEKHRPSSLSVISISGQTMTVIWFKAPPPCLEGKSRRNSHCEDLLKSAVRHPRSTECISLFFHQEAFSSIFPSHFAADLLYTLSYAQIGKHANATWTCLFGSHAF